MTQEKIIILASGSPRRIEIMKSHGYNPIIIPAQIEENLPLYHDMYQTVMFLALKKAQASFETYNDNKNVTVIAADTIVYKDGEIMGKPADRKDAFRMLTKLKDDVHYVVTGVAIINSANAITKVFAEVTKVYFKNYTDEMLNEYLYTDEAYDKAGAYAIQGYFGKYVDHIDGSMDNVIGFPWERIEKEILEFDKIL